MKATILPSGEVVLESTTETRIIRPSHASYSALAELYRRLGGVAQSQADKLDPSKGEGYALEPGYGGWPWKGGEPDYDEVYDIPLEHIHVDPDRFQFKKNADDETGVTTELDDEAFDPDRCEPLGVWKDPRNGLTYVIDGHHRRELGERAGAESMRCQYIQADSAKEARKIGGAMNGVQLSQVDASGHMHRGKGPGGGQFTSGGSGGGESGSTKKLSRREQADADGNWLTLPRNMAIGGTIQPAGVRISHDEFDSLSDEDKNAILGKDGRKLSPREQGTVDNNKVLIRKPAGETDREGAIRAQGHVERRPDDLPAFSSPHRKYVEYMIEEMLQEEAGKFADEADREPSEVSRTYAPGESTGDHTAFWVGENTSPVMVAMGKNGVEVITNDSSARMDSLTLPEYLEEDEMRYRLAIAMGHSYAKEDFAKYGKPKDWKARDAQQAAGVQLSQVAPNAMATPPAQPEEAKKSMPAGSVPQNEYAFSWQLAVMSARANSPEFAKRQTDHYQERDRALSEKLAKHAVSRPIELTGEPKPIDLSAAISPEVQAEALRALRAMFPIRLED